MSSPRSAYVHIPFCHRRCFYCDFPIVPLGDKANGESGSGSLSIKSYLDFLFREIVLVDHKTPLSTIYIGGGTPSILSADQIQSILKLLENQFGLQDGAEVTIEVDPASISFKTLKDYLMVGINRVSLGVQSFDSYILKKIGRIHSLDDIYKCCEWLNSFYENGDIFSWSIDLIQNLPDQTLNQWREQLDKAINTLAPHISVYDLSIEPGTVFEKRQSLGKLNLPDEELSADIFRMTSVVLSNAGFARYELSNFAKPMHSSRHNRVYWSSRGWWGFGLGATSAPWGTRFTRPRTRDLYYKWVVSQEHNGIHHSLKRCNKKPIALDDQLIVGLRRREGLDFQFVGRNYGWSESQCQKYFNALLSKLIPYLNSGLIERRGWNLKLTDPAGMELSNQVLIKILLWWEKLPLDAVR